MLNRANPSPSLLQISTQSNILIIEHLFCIKEVSILGHKLKGNGMWETRFILPEHRSRIIQNYKEHNRREKPTLTEEELQTIAAVVAQSYRQEVEASFELFDPFGNKEIRGIVTRVDQQLRRFRIGEFEWINFSEVLKATCQDNHYID